MNLRVVRWNPKRRLRSIEEFLTRPTFDPKAEAIAAELLEDVRKRGYALDNEENETGVRCIAASLPPVGGGLYALSISAPVERMDNDRIRVLSAYILAMRKEIEQAMKGE